MDAWVELRETRALLRAPSDSTRYQGARLAADGRHPSAIADELGLAKGRGRRLDPHISGGGRRDADGRRSYVVIWACPLQR